MKWYSNRDKFSSNERVILQILTLNEDPTKIWIKYDDVIKMSPMSIMEFQMALQSLVEQRILRIGDQGNGLSLALEEKIEFMLSEKLSIVISEIEKEVQDAIERGDFSLAEDLQKIIDDKRK